MRHITFACTVDRSGKPHPLWELEFFKVNNYPILEQS
jgi:hypothetical protein